MGPGSWGVVGLLLVSLCGEQSGMSMGVMGPHVAGSALHVEPGLSLLSKGCPRSSGMSERNSKHDQVFCLQTYRQYHANLQSPWKSDGLSVYLIGEHFP